MYVCTCATHVTTHVCTHMYTHMEIALGLPHPLLPSYVHMLHVHVHTHVHTHGLRGNGPRAATPSSSYSYVRMLHMYTHMYTHVHTHVHTCTHTCTHLNDSAEKDYSICCYWPFQVLPEQPQLEQEAFSVNGRGGKPCLVQA